ncbi:unnamed protein product [Clonostachys chloroleuca]|uniref:Uncharacterized protein n=1 Tax=Clonostachys chloroleuca TaxID=1926264 RepID=A0AA35Q3Y2_9HYPO|nr:unnamed protein product [Clonostachys chloroleuca]
MAENAPGKYLYDPSLAAAATSAAFFGISTVGHFFQLCQSKTWYFIPFFIGSIFEAAGYVSRCVNAAETPDWSLVPFIIQTLLPLLAPALFAASIYMILGRIIRTLDAEQLSLISGEVVNQDFRVWGHPIICGGGILSGADSKSTLEHGQNVILVGLGIQILFFACFIAAISLFHARIIRQPTTDSLGARVPWRQSILILYFCSVLILARSVFRVAEFAGQDSVLQKSEVYLYCSNTALVLICSVTFNVWHPRRVVTSHNAKTNYTDIELESDQAQATAPNK